MNRKTFLALYARLQRTRTRYAECVRLERTDGTVFRYTTHDRDLHVPEDDGKTYLYEQTNGFNLTAIENQAGLAVSNLEFKSLIDGDTVTRNDLMTGVYDHAKVELFIVYWSNSLMGRIPMRLSWIGEISITQNQWTAELRGIAQKLAQTFVHTTSLECRWDFCDERCGLDPANYTDDRTVDEVRGKDTFTMTASSPSNPYIYRWGMVTWTSGANKGLSMEVIHHFQKKFHLFLPMPFAIAEGDTFSVIEGCDKTYTTCNERFDNMRYFGGEPFLEGSDSLGKVADNKSPEATDSGSKVGSLFGK